MKNDENEDYNDNLIPQRRISSFDDNPPVKPQDLDEPLIDYIINKSGYNKVVWKTLFLASIMIFLEGIYFTSFSIIFIPFQKLYTLSRATVSIIAATMFIGIALGSLSISYLCSKFERVTILNACILFVTLFSVLMGLVKNFIAFTIFRFFIGVFLGIGVPMQFCIVTESLPIFLRSFSITIIWVTFAFGTLFQLWVFQIIMPDLNSDGLNEALLYLSIPNFIFSLIYLFLLNDSARNLIMNKHVEEGFKILESIHMDKFDEEQKQKIIDEIELSENKHYKDKDSNTFLALFSVKHIRTTILLMFIFSITFF